MPDTRSPAETFHALVAGVAERRLDDLPDLYAERTNVRHPFDPLRAAPLTSRDDLRRHFGSGAPGPTTIRRRPANVAIHQTTDPEVIVAEFEYHQTDTRTGAHSTVPCIFVLRVRDGEIVESRDYVDHVASARALGRFDDLVAAISAADARSPGGATG